MRIPDNPKIKLYNYLLDLVDTKDGKEASIYIRNAKPFVEEIWNEIIKNVRGTFRVRETIPKLLGISYGVFYAYKNGRKSIPIQKLYKLILVWKNYCKKSEKEVKDKWNQIFNSELEFCSRNRDQIVKLPKEITPKLSYLMGWLCGDGHFRSTGGQYLIKISEKSTKQLEKVIKPLIRELFNLNVNIYRRYKNGYAVQFSSKPVLRFLINILKIKVGEIPEIVNILDKDNKKWFLRGIFDSEGYVNDDYEYNNHVIVISQSKKAFLMEVSEILKEIGIKRFSIVFHKTSLGKWYSLRIRKLSELVNFSKTIGSLHIDKSRKLQSLVMKIEKSRNR